MYQEDRGSGRTVRVMFSARLWPPEGHKKSRPVID